VDPPPFENQKYQWTALWKTKLNGRAPAPEKSLYNRQFRVYIFEFPTLIMIDKLTGGFVKVDNGHFGNEHFKTVQPFP
jgi:hypothetical protein